MKVKDLNLDASIPNRITKHGIEVKTYLTTAEIGVIVTNCSQIEDVVSRKKIVDEYILKFCADIDVESVEEYDLLLQNGIIEEVKNCVINAGDIDLFIAQSLDMGLVVRNSLNMIINKIPDEKTLKSLVSKVSKQLKDIKRD